jgi:hypothetical protein
MINAKMIKTAERLAKRYETITLENINKVWNRYKTGRDYYFSAKNRLTGFGDFKTHPLCRKACTLFTRNVDYPCCHCIFFNGNVYDDWFCARDKFRKSYEKIQYAETPEELLLAYRERAKVIRRRIKELNKEEEE